MSKDFKTFLLLLTIVGGFLAACYAVNSSVLAVRTVVAQDSCTDDPGAIDCGFGPNDFGYAKYGVGFPLVFHSVEIEGEHTKQGALNDVKITNLRNFIGNYALFGATGLLSCVAIMYRIKKNAHNRD